MGSYGLILVNTAQKHGSHQQHNNLQWNGHTNTLHQLHRDLHILLEYEYDFSNLVCVAKIATCHINLVSRVSLSAGKQREGPRVLGM